MQKHLAGLVLAGITLLAGCGAMGIKGNGTEKTENRPVAEFSRVELRGGYTVEWAPGDPSLALTTDENLLPLIKTTVQDGTLLVETKENIRPTKSVRVLLYSKELSDIKTSGALKLDAKELKGKELRVGSNGASTVKLQGTVETLEVTSNGASDLDSQELKAQTVTLSVNGAGDAKVFASETLKATISGAGSVLYFGKPKNVDQKVNGAGKIKPGE